MTDRMLTPNTAHDGGHGQDMAVETAPNEFIVRTHVPDVRPEDLHIEVVGKTVTVRGQFHEETRQESDVLVLERRSAQFSRTITLPAPVDPRRAEAVVENGVLTLRLPMTAEAQPKAIPVRVK